MEPNFNLPRSCASPTASRAAGRARPTACRAACPPRGSPFGRARSRSDSAGGGIPATCKTALYRNRSPPRTARLGMDRLGRIVRSGDAAKLFQQLGNLFVDILHLGNDDTRPVRKRRDWTHGPARPRSRTNGRGDQLDQRVEIGNVRAESAGNVHIICRKHQIGDGVDHDLLFSFSFGRLGRGDQQHFVLRYASPSPSSIECRRGSERDCLDGLCNRRARAHAHRVQGLPVDLDRCGGALREHRRRCRAAVCRSPKWWAKPGAWRIRALRRAVVAQRHAERQSLL